MCKWKLYIYIVLKITLICLNVSRIFHCTLYRYCMHLNATMSNGVYDILTMSFVLRLELFFYFIDNYISQLQFDTLRMCSFLHHDCYRANNQL